MEMVDIEVAEVEDGFTAEVLVVLLLIFCCPLALDWLFSAENLNKDE